jgi:hypothetical protein
MACPRCNHRMQRVNPGVPIVLRCPHCGALKRDMTFTHFTNDAVGCISQRQVSLYDYAGVLLQRAIIVVYGTTSEGREEASFGPWQRGGTCSGILTASNSRALPLAETQEDIGHAGSNPPRGL